MAASPMLRRRLPPWSPWLPPRPRARLPHRAHHPACRWCSSWERSRSSRPSRRGRSSDAGLGEETEDEAEEQGQREGGDDARRPEERRPTGAAGERVDRDADREGENRRRPADAGPDAEVGSFLHVEPVGGDHEKGAHGEDGEEGPDHGEHVGPMLARDESSEFTPPVRYERRIPLGASEFTLSVKRDASLPLFCA